MDTKNVVQVQIFGHTLPIRSEADKPEGQRFVHREREVTKWSRSLRLPVEVDQAASNAKYENGVLELTLAKKPASAGHKLTIQ